ncbi:MAG: hypothetical protein IIA83_03110, partial [Thaumarchaeota archaeon]|nr:hypothetical protein [Nitrososphaerota archaeon]
TIAEESVVDHRLQFNKSLTESEELEEFYDSELAQKPENNLENWRQLGTDLGELRHFSDYLAFFEFILTDACGVNIAITERTYNYIQYQDEWWQVAKASDVLIRQCG